MALRLYSLYSGSSGNAYFIRAGALCLLIDAGRSLRALTGALDTIGESVSSLCAVLLTHEHTDHTSALRLLCKKHRVPVYLAAESARTPLFCDPSPDTAPLCACLHPFAADQPFSLCAADGISCTVTPFRVPHDSAACVGYRIDTPEGSIGIATDIGYATKGLLSHLCGCDYLIFEANHDVQMLKNGPYPAHLKARILSQGGHLSNADSARCCVHLAQQGARRILLAHLSEHNNTPLAAFRAVYTAMQERNLCERCTVAVALRDEPTCLYDAAGATERTSICHAES